MLFEVAPPGKKYEKLVLKLKKKYGENSEKPFALAWAIYNKRNKPRHADESVGDKYGITGMQDQLLAEKKNSKQNEFKLKELLFESSSDIEEKEDQIEEGNSFQDIVESMSLKEIFQYASANFKKLGEGEGRAVFDIGNNKVVKIAKDKSGIAQNKNESLTYDVL